MEAVIVIKVGNGYIVAPYTVASIPTDGVGVATKLDGGYYGGGRQCPAWAEATHGPVDSPVLPEGAYPVEVAA